MRQVQMLVILMSIFCLAEVHAQVGNNANLLNPNLATADELGALAQLNAATVAAIIAARPFSNAAALAAALGGLTQEQRSAVFGRLFLPLNLNTAGRDEILLIPAMTPRMAHEFEEYRPYTSLEQFRREMAKYVDATEVARLEQYVFVPMNLNSATRDEFLTIPGLTPRMAHEFEEYRPYTSLEQFRREIGKYVDATEVARLERYIIIDK